jgi:hypothetical protein
MMKVKSTDMSHPQAYLPNLIEVKRTACFALLNDSLSIGHRRSGLYSGVHLGDRF